MGIYGYIKNTAPHIDEWSKGAMVFSNAMTVIPITYPHLQLFSQDSILEEVKSIGIPLVKK